MLDWFKLFLILSEGISDTYTLLAGFVAIGIPLAIQEVDKMSDRYGDNTTVYRSTSGVFGVRAIILASVVYLFFSIYVKSFVGVFMLDYPGGVSGIESVSYSVFAMVFVSLLIFCFLISSSLLMYWRLYKHVSGDALLEILRNLKGLGNNQIKYNASHLCFLFDFRSWISLPLNEKESEKSFVERDVAKIDYALARLREELKRDKLKSKKEVLSKIDRAMSEISNRLYYDGGGEPDSNPISEPELKISALYVRFLASVAKDLRSNMHYVESLSAQRNLYCFLSKFIFSRYQGELTYYDFSQDERNRINWIGEVYELARWQANGQEALSTDVILCCEWVSMIDTSLEEYCLSKIDSAEGVFNLLFNVFEMVARKAPSVIEHAYRNISQSVPRNISWNIPVFFDNRWVYKYHENVFNETMSAKEWLDASVNVAEELKVGVKFDGVDYAPLVGSEYESYMNYLTGEDAYLHYLKNRTESFSYKFIALLSYYNRWSELNDCVFAYSDPMNEGVILNRGLINSNVDCLLKGLCERFFGFRFFYIVDRKEILPYLYRGVVFIMSLQKYKGDVFNVIKNTDTADEVLRVVSIYRGLYSASSALMGNEYINSQDMVLLQQHLKKCYSRYMELVRRELGLNFPGYTDGFFKAGR